MAVAVVYTLLKAEQMPTGVLKGQLLACLNSLLPPNHCLVADALKKFHLASILHGDHLCNGLESVFTSSANRQLRLRYAGSLRTVMAKHSANSDSRYIMRRNLAACTSFFFVCFFCIASQCVAQLSVSFGDNGLKRISYGETVLEDTGRYSSDSFHIWHMKVTDMEGSVLTGPADGWGENSSSKIWDASTHTWTYSFSWGTIRTQYVQRGNTLNIVVTETNRAGSGEVLAGASIYPLVLHFPVLPVGFNSSQYPQLAFNVTEPSATLADFGVGEVASVVADATKPLYSGFMPLDNESTSYTAFVSSTTPDGLPAFQPHKDRPVQPGQTDTFTVSLRFAPSGTSLKTLARDAFASWAAVWPPQLLWKDKRIIGTSYLASSPQTDGSKPLSNPRRYFNTSDPSVLDIRTTAGIEQFQSLVLQRAHDIVSNLRRMDAQGVITWDIEGEEYPHATSYVCSPEQLASAAPEMESTISDFGSKYFGQKLVDAYFKTIRDAGFRVGVCVRPQHFTKGPNGTAQQMYLSDTAAESELLEKIRYAHDRWGATLFYLDSTVTSNGGALDAAIFQRLAAAVPDSLLIPEESTPKAFAYTAPFLTFLFHHDLGTNNLIYSYYPNAFSVNLVNDVNPMTLASCIPQLATSVAAGDVLMAHADYWDPNNDTILEIYKSADKLAERSTSSGTKMQLKVSSSSAQCSSRPSTGSE